MSKDRLDGLLHELQVPSDFARYEDVTADTIVRLEEWKARACNVLLQLQDLINGQESGALPVDSVAGIISRVAIFDGDDPWIDDGMRRVSQEIIRSLRPADKNVVERVLTVHIKPLFLASPHPLLNLSTGRRLPRGAGGLMAAQDHYEDQVWKTHPGTGNLVSWCVHHITVDSYEYLWHLVVPPVMTLLDDYQALYRIKGVHIVSEMLTHVPTSLLKRTGVDQLLLTSLSTTLTHLHDKRTPVIVRQTVPVILRLIEKVTTRGSSERFEKHCNLLGENIIGSIWIYASRDADTIQASLDVLPIIVQALGVGTIRYLKALIPQCLHAITPYPFNPRDINMELSALRALSVIINECQPRIYRWRGTIIEGIGKGWVAVMDAEFESADIVKSGLHDVLRALAKACPTVQEDEFSRLSRVDEVMFGRLLTVTSQ